MKKPQAASHKPQSSLTSLDYAYQILARRAYSEQELAHKLLARGFSEEGVARTVARLKEQGYLNDNSLAADQVERFRRRGFGREGIRAKLVQKGLSDATIEQTLAEGGGEKELDSARQFLASRFSADALKHPRQYARAFRFLLRRGYGQEVVENLLGSAPTEIEK